MNWLLLLRGLLATVAAYYASAAVRERRTLRRELQQIRHEIDEAIGAGDAARIGELQDDYADASASLDALLAAAKPAAEAGANAPR